MRLVDLKPRWWGARDRRGLGMSFECPCPVCRLAAHEGYAYRIVIAFSNPLDGGEPAADIVAGPHWHREGDSFEDLSVTPSIDASHRGHWHGFISQGDVR